MLLTFFWLSSFSVSRYVVGSSIPAIRGTRAPFVGVYERVAIGVSCSFRLHRIEGNWRCPVVSSSVVPSVGTVSSRRRQSPCWRSISRRLDCSSDDWLLQRLRTEFQESDCWGKCLIRQYDETTCCQRCVSFYFERSCPEQRPRAALKPQEPHSSGPWTPSAPVEVLAGPRESRGRGRGVVASCKSYLYRIEASWRCPVASSAVPSVGSALCISHNVRFPLRFGRDRLTSSQARVGTEIAGGQPRTPVPQLSLRRNVSPPGRGSVHP
jgi:hypothetical protein